MITTLDTRWSRWSNALFPQFSPQNGFGLICLTWPQHVNVWKKTSKERTTTCRRDSLSARRVNRFCFSKHGAGSTKRSFPSLLFLYGWHFPPVSFEEFLTPGVFLCCQFVAGLVRMRIFPASIIPESPDTRCFYPLKKKSKNTIISSEFPTILEQLTQDGENPQEAE